MQDRKKRIIGGLFALFSFVVAVGAYLCLWQYNASVTEAAFSLCAKTMNSEDQSAEKAKKVKDYLTFARMPEASKQKLLEAIRDEDPALFAIAEKMEYFSYSGSALRDLCLDIDDLKGGSVSAFRVSKSGTAEENAKELIRKLFGRRVAFQTEEGDGTNYIKRYYCANICVDACPDGSIRYLSDIRAAGGEDPLIALLFSSEGTETVKTEEICGIVYKTVRSKAARADLCIHAQTGRVIAAKILFNS